MTKLAFVFSTFVLVSTSFAVAAGASGVSQMDGDYSPLTAVSLKVTAPAIKESLSKSKVIRPQ